jgi:outer membrane biosynthesis protein TonB
MKTSQILASLFFGSLAAAVPINQRDLVTKTEMVVETVVVYTTVWDDEPVAEATTTAAAFYEQPASAVEAKPTTTSTPTPTPEAVKTPVSVYTPPVQTPTPQPAPTTSAAPAPKVEESKVEEPKVETQAAPKPTTTAAPAPEPKTTEAAPAPAPTTEAAPAPAPTTEAAAAPAPSASAAPAPASGSYPSSGSSDQFSGDITIYQTQGGYGACGTQLNDSDMIVALSHVAWGASTYDVMTGAASNPWCGQEINVHYKGNSIKAKIMDMCPGCKGDDIDLSPAAWKALTGSDEMTRYQATWSKAS